MAVASKVLNPLAVRVGKKIRDLRKERGMKQETLALEAGYGSRSAIAAIETGLILPSLDKSLDIARALGVTVSDILEDSPGLPSGFNDQVVLTLLGEAGRQATDVVSALRHLLHTMESFQVRGEACLQAEEWSVCLNLFPPKFFSPFAVR